MKPWIARDRFYSPWVGICNIQLQIGHKKSPKAKTDFSGGSDSSEPACNVGDLGWIPGSDQKIWRKEWLPTPVFYYSPQGHKNLDMTEQLTLWAFLVTQMIKNLPAVKETQVRSLVPGSERSPGEGHGNPLQDSCLENPMDRGAWRATVHGVAKSRTHLSNWQYY